MINIKWEDIDPKTGLIELFETMMDEEMMFEDIEILEEKDDAS